MNDEWWVPTRQNSQTRATSKGEKGKNKSRLLSPTQTTKQPNHTQHMQHMQQQQQQQQHRVQTQPPHTHATKREEKARIRKSAVFFCSAETRMLSSANSQNCTQNSVGASVGVGQSHHYARARHIITSKAQAIQVPGQARQHVFKNTAPHNKKPARAKHLQCSARQSTKT